MLNFKVGAETFINRFTFQRDYDKTDWMNDYCGMV